MKVIEIGSDEGKRYMLLNREGEPVIPAMKYLKYLFNIGRAENTIKSYEYHLKLYFEFLEVEKLIINKLIYILFLPLLGGYEVLFEDDINSLL